MHGCASCREPSPLPCSVPINAIHMLGSIPHGIFFSATIMPHYLLYTAPSAPSLCLTDLSWSFTATLLSLPYTQLPVAFVVLSRWRIPFLRLFPDPCRGLKFYHCAQAHSQKALSSSGIPPVTNLCPRKLKILEISLMSLSMSFKTYRPPSWQWHKDIFSNVCLWKVSSFCWTADHIFKSRILLSALFCTTVHMAHIVVLYPTVSGTETTQFLENHGFLFLPYPFLLKMITQNWMRLQKQKVYYWSSRGSNNMVLPGK